MPKRVLIIDNDPRDLKNLERWTYEAAERKGQTVEVETVRKDYREEIEAWFNQRYPSGAQNGASYDLLLLDIIFKSKDGQKQDYGGVQLWQYLQQHGIDSCIGRLIVPTNQTGVEERFKKLGVPARVVAKGDRDRVIDVLMAYL